MTATPSSPIPSTNTEDTLAEQVSFDVLGRALTDNGFNLSPERLEELRKIAEKRLAERSSEMFSFGDIGGSASSLLVWIFALFKNLGAPSDLGAEGTFDATNNSAKHKRIVATMHRISLDLEAAGFSADVVECTTGMTSRRKPDGTFENACNMPGSLSDQLAVAHVDPTDTPAHGLPGPNPELTLGRTAS